MKITESGQFSESIGLDAIPKSHLTFEEWMGMDEASHRRYMYAVRRTLFDGNSMLCTKNEAWLELHRDDLFLEGRIGSLDRGGRKEGLTADLHDAAIIEETIKYVTGIDVRVAYWGWKGYTQVVRLKFRSGFTVLVFVGDHPLQHPVSVIVNSTNTFLLYLTAVAYAVTLNPNTMSAVNGRRFRVFFYDDMNANEHSSTIYYQEDRPIFEYVVSPNCHTVPSKLNLLLYGDGSDIYDYGWFDCVDKFARNVIGFRSYHELLDNAIIKEKLQQEFSYEVAPKTWLFGQQKNECF